MAYVIQHPHSVTNPTNKYRVTDAADLMRYINGAALRYSFVEYSNYETAEEARNTANGVSTPAIKL